MFGQKGFAQYIHLIIGVIVGIALLEIFTVIFKSNNPPPSIPITSSTNSPVKKNPQLTTVTSTLDLQKQQKYLTVEASLLGISDNMSLYFKDLNQPNQEITVDPTRSWIPASTIKSFVVLEAFRQRDLGTISFDQPVTIVADNVVPTELETEDYPRLREGTSATIGQLLGAMITQSDNTAYNSLLDVLDRRQINITLKNYGLTETVVGEKLNLDDAQFQKDLTITGRQPNTTTVKDLATFFDLLYTHQAPDSEEILAIFKKQKINNMIPALLPQDTIVAHKTGDWAPIFHDGGVVYKKDDPFILSIFTNANNPGAIAQMAKVAFYSNAQTVGQDITTPGKPVSLNSNQAPIYLALSDQSRVLGVQQSQTFPQVTAEDLGITPSDLSLFNPQNTNKISSALITPDSFLYGVKRLFENISLHLPFYQNQQTDSAFYQTNNRLSELKSSLKKGDLENSDKLLAESEEDLKQAIDSATKSGTVNSNLTEAKQLNDLHYATLAEEAKNIDPQQKEQFIDLVYRFEQKNSQEIKPILAKSVIANPLQQKPLIGTIKEVSDKKAVIQFDDGSKKDVTLDQFTPIRDFHSDQIDSQNNLQVGSKIAIVGQTTTSGAISPEFILKNIPHELPDKHQGTVLEIDPKDKILKIKEESGESTIQLSNSTILKGSDTSVSLEGIKAGSTITVFGEYQSTPSATLQNSNPQNASSSSQNKDSSNPTPKPSGTVGPVTLPTNSSKPVSSSAPNPNSSSKPQSSPTPTSPQTIIKATSIQVIQNSSGKQETSQPKTQAPQPPAPAKSVTPPPPTTPIKK